MHLILTTYLVLLFILKEHKKINLIIILIISYFIKIILYEKYIILMNVCILKKKIYQQ
jgi:hypothetical protein